MLLCVDAYDIYIIYKLKYADWRFFSDIHGIHSKGRLLPLNKYGIKEIRTTFPVENVMTTKPETDAIVICFLCGDVLC